jgi:ABC-type transport system involved in cytochrome bd biosynthesis fused ATPase/permease subunit
MQDGVRLALLHFLQQLTDFQCGRRNDLDTALDIVTEAKLIKALRNLSGKLTIVIVAHRLSAVAACDKLVDLSNKSAVVAETAR